MSEDNKQSVAKTPETKALVATKGNDIATMLGNMKSEFALVLPKHLTPDRLVRMAVTQLRINPSLNECHKMSFVAAIMTAAQLGLEPDGVLGHAYLVPFKSNGIMNVQLIPGYKGLLALARNSGEVSSISAHEVYEKDEFEFQFGLEEKLIHKPARGDRGKITHFYAIAKFKDGGHHMDVMTVEDIETVRNRSSGYKAFKAGYTKSAIWDEHFVEMGRKTVIRRIAKYLPLNVQRAAAIDSMYEAGKNTQIDKFGEFVIEGEGQEVSDSKQLDKKPANLDQLEASLEKQPEPSPAPVKSEDDKQKEMDDAHKKHQEEEAARLSKLKPYPSSKSKKEPEQMGLVP